MPKSPSNTLVKRRQRASGSGVSKDSRAIRLDFGAMMADSVGSQAGILPSDLASVRPRLEEVHRSIIERKGPGNDFLGFLDLPYQPGEAIERIIESADRLAAIGDRCIVLGIGGSYLGACAVLDALCDPFRNERNRHDRAGRPRIYFEGNNMDPDAVRALLDLLPAGKPQFIEQDFTINVISKSGTTLETAVAFRLLRQRAEQVYGRDYAKHIVATTDATMGLLHDQAVKEGFEAFVIPNSVGGRFSVLTPVGLLPSAVAGVDIRELVAGARAMAERCHSSVFEENPALMVAALQYLSYQAGRGVSVMMSWGKALASVATWYDQLCAESLGKNNQGRIPLAAVGSRDLHSRGQELQQGPRNVVVTHLVADCYPSDLVVCWDQANADGLNYLAGRTVGQMLHSAYEATVCAYTRDERPSMTVHLPRIDAFSLGQLFYMYEFATVAEGYLTGVNPLDQPGVEDYKRFMFGILGRADMTKWKREFDAGPPVNSAYQL